LLFRLPRLCRLAAILAAPLLITRHPQVLTWRRFGCHSLRADLPGSCENLTASELFYSELASQDPGEHLWITGDQQGCRKDRLQVNTCCSNVLRSSRRRVYSFCEVDSLAQPSMKQFTLRTATPHRG
jgi:hypothetical protein